jgi:histidine phosphotransferase ChpT
MSSLVVRRLGGFFSEALAQCIPIDHEQSKGIATSLCLKDCPPMTANSLDLASLLCSRLCHDMLSPVGALNNGIELIIEEKDPEMRKRCFELLEQSAKISADKLKFFRLAFGAAGGYGDMVPVEEARSVIDALAGNNGRIAVTWSFGGEVMPKPAVKTLLNLALIGIEALVRGGTLDIGAEMRANDSGATSEIVVRAAGSRIAFDKTIGQALTGELHPSELSSRTAPAAMIHQLAASLGGGLQYVLSDDSLVLGAVLPGG